MDIIVDVCCHEERAMGLVLLPQGHYRSYALIILLEDCCSATISRIYCLSSNAVWGCKGLCWKEKHKEKK